MRLDINVKTFIRERLPLFEHIENCMLKEVVDLILWDLLPGATERRLIIQE